MVRATESRQGPVEVALRKRRVTVHPRALADRRGVVDSRPFIPSAHRWPHS
jgi:hypothetical protein